MQLKSAQQAEDVANARYKNGLDSILDVLSAQATLANARVQEVQARLNWFAALAAMGHAVGGLDAPKDTDGVAVTAKKKDPLDHRWCGRRAGGARGTAGGEQRPREPQPR